MAHYFIYIIKRLSIVMMRNITFLTCLIVILLFTLRDDWVLGSWETLLSTRHFASNKDSEDDDICLVKWEAWPLLARSLLFKCIRHSLSQSFSGAAIGIFIVGSLEPAGPLCDFVCLLTADKTWSFPFSHKKKISIWKRRLDDFCLLFA